ncbi:hypothetical protein QUF58_11815 [Anaerolineales bacterium HSG24]|nr:hypothetical protein [Anaerolineales bacterium HSG24]
MSSQKKQFLTILLVVTLLVGSAASTFAAPTYQETVPSVTVTEQVITDGSVTVASVVSLGAGWIVIHADEAGTPGAVIGQAAVVAGENSNVVVTIDATAATDTLYAILHEDVGTEGTYEADVDVPVMVDEVTVTSSFTVTAETATTEGEAETTTEGEAETATTEGEAETATTEGEAETATTEGEAETVTTEGEAETATTEGEAETATTEGEAETVATEGEAETATTEGEAETVATEGEAETATEETTETVETAEVEVAMVDGCKAYTVDAGDSLLRIAFIELGDGNAYQTIIDATNEAAASGDDYSTVEDANMLSIGQVLCIPTATPVTEEATAEGETVAATEETTGTVETAIEETPAISTNQMFVEDVEIPEGKIALLFENLSVADFIVDIIGPTTMDAQLILPTQKVVFILAPGSYRINGHSPGGDFGFTGATFDASVGQWAELISYGGTSQLTVKDLEAQPATEIVDEAPATEIVDEAPATEIVDEAATDEAATDEATTDEAATDEATTDETATDEATTDETATDEAATDETATDEAATDEAATDEATTDEAATDEATTDEATTDDTSSSDVSNSFAPNEGQGRIYFQNLYTGEFNVDLGDGSGAIIVPPAAENLFRDVAPGSFTPGLSLPGGGATNLQFEVAANTSWVIILLEDGRVGAIQIYPQQ